MRPSYAVVIEEAEGNFCAHVPDLPGCVATGDTRDEVLVQIREMMAILDLVQVHCLVPMFLNPEMPKRKPEGSESYTKKQRSRMSSMAK